jgi:hypothetical protein
VEKPVEDVDNSSEVRKKASGVTRRRVQGVRGGWREAMYSGTMVSDLISMVEKAEREAETREMLEGELAQARVYTLIWNVPAPIQRYLSQGVA